jgi:hypothetical protein
MFWLFRSTDIDVMLQVSFAERTVRPVQQPAMVGIFKAVTPNQAYDNAYEPSRPCRMKIETENQTRNSAGNKCDDRVVTFLCPPMVERD